MPQSTQKPLFVLLLLLLLLWLLSLLWLLQALWGGDSW